MRGGAPGAVALVRNGGHVQADAAGVADLQSDTPMRVGMRFRVGSISKTVVATLIFTLAERHRLTLSDSVGDWLPGALPARDHITIMQLLRQRSGLPDYLQAPALYDLLLGGKTALGEHWTPDRLLRLVAGRRLDFVPGSRFEYSNTNYLLLGMLVQRVTGMPLGRYAAKTLFGPLHMAATSFALGRLTGTYAHGYMPSVGPFQRAPHNHGDVAPLNGSHYAGAAALVSDAADLDRFYHALFTGQIISGRDVATMQQTVSVPPGFDYQRYGAGLEGSHYPCGWAWGHGGSVWGYRAAVRSTRDAHTLVILLVNADQSTPNLYPALTTAIKQLFCAP